MGGSVSKSGVECRWLSKCFVSSEASLNYFLLCKPSLGVSPPHIEVITSSSVTIVHCLGFYYILIILNILFSIVYGDKIHAV